MSDASRSGIARPVGWRLFLTVWLVYSAFATTNVVRETYLAITLGEKLSVRVDEYHGLHPDLFEIPGRGWYINNNPGASMLGAIPYGLLVRPAIALATRVSPGIRAPRPPAAYDDPRENRTRFMNAARARGLDIVLGLAALGTGITMMAPLGAFTAVLMFAFLRRRGTDDRRALWSALAFAFATPMFFRAAFINQNFVLASLVFAAYVLMVGLTPRPPGAAPGPRTLAGIGLLLGFGLVCDYSAAPFLLVFGVWVLADAWRRGGARQALAEATTYGIAALAAIGLLLAYQWVAFGHPVWPAQRYMPPTPLSVRGWFGFSVPTVTLLGGNLFDLRYGLFAFCPLLATALAAPWVRDGSGRPPHARVEGWPWIMAMFAALLVFSSANQFANLQWNTGVRYMVPIAPLLFVAAVPVLTAIPRWLAGLLVGTSVIVSLAVTMTRETIPAAFPVLLDGGPTLPILLVLKRVASAYPEWQFVAGAFWVVALALGAVLAFVWRRWQPSRTAA